MRLFLLVVCVFSALAIFVQPAPAANSFAPCDASDFQTILGKHAIFEATASVKQLIDDRRAACEVIVDAYSTPEPPPPPKKVIFGYKLPEAFQVPLPPRPQCTAPGSDVTTAYAILYACTQWVAKYVTAPGATSSSTPAPPAMKLASPSPEPPLPVSNGAKPAPTPTPIAKVVYILALATDAPTSAQLSIELANELRVNHAKTLRADPYLRQKVQYEVLPEPGWTISQYQQTCAADNTTAGALVALQPSTQSASWNYLLVGSWTAVGMQVMALDCEPGTTANSNGTSSVTWISEQNTNAGRRVSFSLATAQAIAAGILAFAPNHTTTYTTTPVALPPPGQSYQSSYTTTTNQGAGYAASVGVAALTPLSSANIGEGAGTDAQTARSILKDINVLFGQMSQYCATHPAPTVDQLAFDETKPLAPVPATSHCNWFEW